MDAKEHGADLSFFVKKSYKFNGAGMVLDFLWNGGCTSLSPFIDENPKVKNKSESECFCYHGPPGAKLVEAYGFLYEQFKKSGDAKFSRFGQKGRDSEDANFGLYSRRLTEQFLLDPKSMDFEMGLKYSVCPCYKIAHFGLNTHSWYFDVNLPLYTPMIIGNLLKNTYLSVPENVESCVKKGYFSKMAEEQVFIKNDLKIAQSIPHENVLVRYLISEGLISEPGCAGGVCQDQPLLPEQRERAKKTGWEGSSSEASSEESVSETR